MKLNIYKVLALLFTAILVFAACDKEEETALEDEGEQAVFQSEITGERLASLQEQLSENGFGVFEEPAEPPEFTLETPDGEERSLESFRGRLVLLNFWASWCGPCGVEKPSMVNLYSKLKDEGLTIIGINLQENASTAKSFMDKHDITYPVLLDKSGNVAGKYGVRGIPTTYIIDQSGKALGGVSGALEWDSEQLVSLFKDMLSVKM